MYTEGYQRLLDDVMYLTSEEETELDDELEENELEFEEMDFETPRIRFCTSCAWCVKNEGICDNLGHQIDDNSLACEDYC